VKPVALFEEHGEVLAHWASQGFRNETIICFDRHIDIKRISKKALCNLKQTKLDPLKLRELYREQAFDDRDSGAYGLDDFVYAAIHLGLTSRFVLVLTETSQFTKFDLAKILWEHLAEIPGHGSGVLETFKITDYGATAMLGDASVCLTIERLLHLLPKTECSKVDFDLDYFADEYGHYYHHPTKTVGILKQLKLAHQVVSMSYSISSGFMPDSMRILANELVGLLGCETQSLSRLSGKQLNCIKLLSRDGAISREDVIRASEQELRQLGATGIAIAAALALRAGMEEEAESFYWHSQEVGQKAYWVAYRFGLHHLSTKQYSLAVNWFSRGYPNEKYAEIDCGAVSITNSYPEICDHVELKSAFLECLCHLRLGHANTALEGLVMLSILVPNCEEVNRMGVLAAQMSCKNKLVRRFELNLHAIRGITSQWIN